MSSYVHNVYLFNITIIKSLSQRTEQVLIELDISAIEEYVIIIIIIYQVVICQGGVKLANLQTRIIIVVTLRDVP